MKTMLTLDLMTEIDPIVYNDYYKMVDIIHEKEDYCSEYDNDFIIDDAKGLCNEAIWIIKSTTDQIDEEALSYINRMLDIHIKELAKLRMEMFEFKNAVYNQEWIAGDYDRHQFLKYSIDLYKIIINYYKQILRSFK